MDFLHSYDWPGNVRELESTIEYMVAVVDDKTVTKAQLPLEFFHESTRQNDHQLHFELSLGQREADEFHFLLEAIKHYNDSGEPIGRKLLSQLSRSYRYYLSEDQIRKRTDKMTEMGLLMKYRGRSGMQISKKGTAFLAVGEKKDTQ